MFRSSGGEWTQSATLPPDAPVVALTTNAVSGGDEFGRAVAIDGGYVIVGAPRDDTEAEDAGVAYVYERCASTPVICQQPWGEVGVLTASDAAAGDLFGWSVAIAGDYALVGAYEKDDDSAGSGSAYVFQRSGDAWNQVNKPTASDAAAGDQFGRSMAIDGNYALIGALFDDDDGASSGSGYVYLK